MLAAGLIGSACGKNSERVSGNVGPVNGTTTTSTSAPSPSPSSASNIAYEPYSYDSSQGNTSGTSVTLDVPQGWDETSSLSRRDYRNSARTMLFRLDFSRPANGSAIGNWQAVETEFDNSHEAYKRIALHSVDCPSGALDCADWEFSFVETGVTRHVIDRGIVVNQDLGFAVYVSAPEAQFPEMKQIFQHTIASLKIGG